VFGNDDCWLCRSCNLGAKEMIRTVIIEEDTPSKLTLRINDFLKQWKDEQIVDIKYAWKDRSLRPYSAMVILKT
jgi:hypothetical protein